MINYYFFKPQKMSTANAFKSEEEHKQYFQLIRSKLSDDGRTIRNGLSAGDRYFLRLFFHYESHPDAERSTKQKSRDDCPAYLRELIFENTDGNGDASQQNQEDNNLLSNDFRSEDEKSLSRIFTGSYSHDETKTRWPLRAPWFKFGEHFDELQQAGFVRTMQDLSRIYSPDLSFKKLRFGTKILITGPVKFAFFPFFLFLFFASSREEKERRMTNRTYESEIRFSSLFVRFVSFPFHSYFFFPLCSNARRKNNVVFFSGLRRFCRSEKGEDSPSPRLTLSHFPILISPSTPSTHSTLLLFLMC